MERRVTTVARRLLSMLEENWEQSWLQGILRGKDSRVPRDMLPEVLEEMVLLSRRKVRRQ